MFFVFFQIRFSVTAGLGRQGLGDTDILDTNVNKEIMYVLMQQEELGSIDSEIGRYYITVDIAHTGVKRLLQIKVCCWRDTILVKA